MKHSTIKLSLFIAIALIFTAYTHIEMKKRENRAIEYINTHSDGTDASIQNAIDQAKDIYNLPPYLVEDLKYSYYL